MAHKVAPSIATNNRMVLKPTEKTPLTALLLADILYEAGLPPQMLSVVTGDPREIADEMLTNPDVDLVTFTGGVPIGKYIAAKAVYKRQVLELGGNDPIIVLEDADLDEAATLAATRLVQELRPALHGGQAHAGAGKRRRPLRRAPGRAGRRPGRYGDPFDPAIDMGTVIDEAPRAGFEAKVNDAVGAGRQAAVRQRPPTARCIRRPCSTTSRPTWTSCARDLRPGLAGHPLQGRRRRDPHRQLRPPTACRRRSARTASTTSRAS